MSDVEVSVNKNEYTYTFHTPKSITWFNGYFVTNPFITYLLVKPIIRKYNQNDKNTWDITYTTDLIHAKTDNIEIEYTKTHIIIKYINYKPDTYVYSNSEHVIPPRNKIINMTLILKIQNIAKYHYDVMCGIIPKFDSDVIRFSPTLLALYYDLIIQQIKTDKEYVFYSKNQIGCRGYKVRRYGIFNDIIYKWQCLISDTRSIASPITHDVARDTSNDNIEILEVCENKMISLKKIQFDGLRKWSDNVWRELFAKVLCELIFMPNIGIMYQKAYNHYQKLCKL
jgi:hypothetical protein